MQLIHLSHAKRILNSGHNNTRPKARGGWKMNESDPILGSLSYTVILNKGEEV